jgi:Spirocyclase AveC-like
MAATVEAEPEVAPAAPGPSRSTLVSVAWGLLAMALLAAIVAVAHNMRAPGVLADRVENPDVTGAPRPVEPLFGDPHWLAKLQLGTVAMVTVVVVVCFVFWRRHPKHPILLCAIACTGIVWLDPVMNWAPYAVYNPELWHMPETWALVSLSPTVEPFVVLGYVSFYLAPFFPAIWLLRRIQRRRPVTSFPWRHPLISLAVLVYVIGFVYDAMLEIFSIRAGLYIYSQVIPFGSVFTGEAYQFPLLWESSLVTLVMIPAAVLLYRDDTGRTVAEKLAQRLRFRSLQSRPALATFVVIFGILNLAYAGYGLGFAAIRWSRLATSVACPYPYPEAKVYDPNGFYAEAGQPGPYFAGIWSGWMSLQPDGRPDVETDPDGRCSPDA